MLQQSSQAAKTRDLFKRGSLRQEVLLTSDRCIDVRSVGQRYVGSKFGTRGLVHEG